MSNNAPNSNFSLQIHQILKHYWGYDSFRPLQEDIILSVMQNRDTLALLPTGGGKSICFQVPALAKEGLCIVISPLIALMKDQVENLKKRGIKAAAIFSGLPYREIELIINNATFDKDFKFLYLSPERLKTDTFRASLEKLPVSMIAVDEAHCISQWGYDFRPPYLEIATIRPYFPEAPILALTATATPEVVIDIQEKLIFKEKNLFQKSFKRDNLIYYVVKEEDKFGRMLRIVQRYPGTGVIYVRNRRKTKEIADFLNKHGISADYYHAGLDTTTRDRKQNDWMVNKTRIIVSTNAFGMGIDKPDVRFVIHLDIPDTLEAYFQEAGRGGRDEKSSVAIMLYDGNDIKELKRNFALTFPTIDQIRQIYLKLGNYYQIAIRSGKNSSFPFELEMFAKISKSNITILYHAIKYLEKIGLLLYLEDENRVSVMHVLANQKALDIFEQQYPELYDFLKVLLRSYSALFTDFVKINEAEIARRTDRSEEEVVALLKKIHKLKIISYRPKTLKPTLIFTEDRIRDYDITLDAEHYNQRKKVAKQRLNAVIDYVKEENSCRSQVLLRYFGEMKSQTCGACDICIKKRLHTVTEKEFQNMKIAVLTLLTNKTYSIREVVTLLNKDFKEEKLVKVIRQLIDNNEINLKYGQLSRHKPT